MLRHPGFLNPCPQSAPRLRLRNETSVPVCGFWPAVRRFRLRPHRFPETGSVGVRLFWTSDYANVRQYGDIIGFLKKTSGSVPSYSDSASKDVLSISYLFLQYALCVVSSTMPGIHFYCHESFPEHQKFG